MGAAAQTPHPPTEIPVQLVVRREHDHWSAIAIDYTITGQGASAEDAVQDAIDSLCFYLVCGLRDGESLEQLKRPISAGWRLRIQSEFLAGKLARHASRLPRLERRALQLPDGGTLAHC